MSAPVVEVEQVVAGSAAFLRVQLRYGDSKMSACAAYASISRPRYDG